MPLEQCDMAVLTALAAPQVDPSRPVLASGRTTAGGVELAGARVVMLSDHPVAAWAQVLRAPEKADEWHPASMGTRRVERLDANHIFQQLDITILLGAIHIRRQIVVGSSWLESSAAAVRSCWYGSDPSPYRTQIAPWVDDSPWEYVTHGSWDIRARPDGKTLVSYQFWSPSKSLLPQIQAWAMSTTLPELLSVFETHVGEVAAGAPR